MVTKTRSVADRPKQLKVLGAFVCWVIPVVTLPLTSSAAGWQLPVALVSLAGSLTLFGWAFYHPSRGRFRLIGPLAAWEMIRAARRERLALSRFVLGLTVVLVFFVIYQIWLEGIDRSGSELTVRQMAEFATTFFASMLTLMFVGGVIVTPTLVANAIVEERDRRSLEFLLTTDLHTQEIILGKFVARVLTIFSILLLLLPIFSLLPLFGGVDPSLVITVFMITFVTITTLSSLTIYLALIYPKPSLASGAVIGVAILYNFLCQALSGLAIGFPELAQFPANVIPQFPVTVNDLVQILLMGTLSNTINALGNSGAALTESVLESGGNYVRFHLVVSMLFLLQAMRVLRPSINMVSNNSAVRQDPLKLMRPGARPRVFEHGPIVWREIFCESAITRRQIWRNLSHLFYLLSFLPVVIIIGYALANQLSSGQLSVNVNVYVRPVGSIILGLMVMAVLGHAARSIGRERDRNSLEELFLTDLSGSEIVRQKWLGSILAPRKALIWLVVHWLIAMVVGALNLFGFLVLMIATVVYLSFAASLGMLASVMIEKTKTATARAHGILVLLIVAPYGVLALVSCLIATTVGTIPTFAPLVGFLLGLSPATICPLAVFTNLEFQWLVTSSIATAREPLTVILGIIVGGIVNLIIYGLSSYLLLNLACARLEAMRRVRADVD